MAWMPRVTCRMHDLRAARDTHRERKEIWRRQKADWRERKRAGDADALAQPGPPNGFALLPWLFMGLGAFSHLLQGKTPNPWIGGLGLFVFNSLYVAVAFRAFDKRARESRATLAALLAMGAITLGLAVGYGGNWLMYFPLFGLAVGAVIRGRRLGPVGLGLSALAGAVAGLHEGWDGISIAYGTFLSTMVTAAILSLSEAVRDLRAAREELARRAVAEERLRFSRDLHDLLGHTLSLIVVKSEAARRLAPRNMEVALTQIEDIETVGRQALTEIREAVTGYRDAALAAELDRARELLDAAGVEAVVRQSGPPLGPRTEALLGWVVREAATNVVRHARAGRCEIEVAGAPGETRLVVTDDGRGEGSTAPGSGLTGLGERLTAAGGSLESGPGPRGGFRVVAVLPGDAGTGGAGPEPTLAGAPEQRV
ncbi:sensor histidine kinase [Streptomyces aurantiacus]|uniref:Putative Sensor histidine kinase YfiJ n=1 Tax=Streptomyces aurantiacus JA 4570 TaxID=1286094 RepID=S4A1G7_9ACTN|nr:sensor histidine kinase [Streptomyces aurantiacus]EPH44525.1 putative Sensor histidine kinase YfiJ [Streptomyces aurantiacus JA 4570]